MTYYVILLIIFYFNIFSNIYWINIKLLLINIYNLICYYIKEIYEVLNNYINILNKYLININKDNINKLKFLDNYTEEEKGYYLSGLFEGDGNIYTRRFIIIFSLEDIILAPAGGHPPPKGGDSSLFMSIF